MNTKRYIQSALLGCLLSLGLTAQAAFIDYTTSFSADNFSTTAATTGSTLSNSGTTSGVAYLNRFDSSLGTLTGVEISFTSDWTHDTYASAYDSVAQSTLHAYTYTYSCGWFSTCTATRYYYTYSNDTSISANSYNTLSLSLVDPASATNTSIDYNYTSCSNYTGINSAIGCSNSQSTTGVFSGVLDLSAFGLSQFTTSDPTIDPLAFSLHNTADINGTCDYNDPGDSCSARTESAWNGSITVGYTYDGAQVSEPASLLLFSAGLLGLGFRRKLREKRRPL